MDEVTKHVTQVEKDTGKKFGDTDNPLLVSVRSGAAVSMPGMMDTVLNLGLNDACTCEGLAKLTGNARFAYDAYRRLINMFGDVVMGVEHEHFEHELRAHQEEANGVKLDTDLGSRGPRRSSSTRYKEVYEAHRRRLPAGPDDQQLEQAIDAVFKSWNTDRAIRYRQINDITRPARHRRQRADHGLRQHGRDSGHRRGLHPRPLHRREQVLRRVPGQRPGRRRGGRHPHAAARARRWPSGTARATSSC